MNVTVFNGLEVVDYNSNNAQANVFDARKGGTLAVYGIAEFSTWPYLLARGTGANFDKKGLVKRTEIGNRLTIERKLEDFAARWVVDRKTGFVYVESLRSTRKGTTGQVIHQYGPTVFHDSVVLPRVHIKLNLLNEHINQIFVDRIEHADLAYRPNPLDFVIAPPAGTLIIDYREDREHPKMGTAHYPSVDVIVYADGMSSRNRQIEPVLKVGQPAPVLRPASWLDRNGPTDPTDLTGKVVLINFWGITCGPCVAQLPEVQAAAAHFASKGDRLVLIGLHESGTAVDQVAEFATKHALTYRLAIDRPADEDGWFGATFKAYGVRAIPSAAVIDRQGRVVFVGRFNEALQQAASLLEK
jgi:thiol-disulfide isomerase/thioredoxin